MNKAPYLITLILFFLAQSVVFAEDKKPQVSEAINLVELWLDAQRDYEQIPGISMSVVDDQQIVWKQGFGYSDLDKKSPTTTKTIYSICSISKLFTSIAAMKLRDQGKFQLDDPLDKLLPWFKIENTYPDGQQITVRGILTHSSGLPRESDYPYWTPPDFDFPTHEQIVERIREQKTLYPAYTYFQYSNLGLTLVGEIVAELSGNKFGAYVQENIINPLSLNDTRPRMPEELWGDQLAVGYSAITRQAKRNKMPFFQANGITPAAGFSSTVEDLAEFASWQFRLLETNQTEVIKANTLREMQRVQYLDPNWKTAWGLGFAVRRINDETFVGHQGSCPGYRSSLLMKMDKKIGIVFMANASGVNAGKYARGTYAIFAPAIEAARDTSSSQKMLSPAFEKFRGIYTFEPWGGEMAIIPWKGELAAVFFPSAAPLEDLTKLIHIEGNVFKSVRDDDQLGETLEFIVDEDGKVSSVKQHSNFWAKIR